MATADGRGRGADPARLRGVLKYSDSSYFLLHPAGVVRPDEGEEEGGNAAGRLGDSNQATGGAATPASKNEDLPPGNPFISPLFLLPLDLVLIGHVLQLQKSSFSMLLSRSEAQSLEILCSALPDISSD